MKSTHLIKTRYEITLSYEALAGIETVAKTFNLSVSELFEWVGCGQLAIVNPEDTEDLEDYLDKQIAIEVEADSDRF